MAASTRFGPGSSAITIKVQHPPRRPLRGHVREHPSARPEKTREGGNHSVAAPWIRPGVPGPLRTVGAPGITYASFRHSVYSVPSDATPYSAKVVPGLPLESVLSRQTQPVVADGEVPIVADPVSGFTGAVVR